MAYAAVISLKQTINGLLNSSRISSSSSAREILKFAHNQTTSLQQVLQKLNSSSRSSEGLDALDGQIRDCANKLEDILEFNELNQLYSQEEKCKDEGDLEEVRQEITSFAETVGKDYVEELSKPEADDDDAAFATSSVDNGVEMVGHCSEFNIIRNHLLAKMRPDNLCLFSFFGEKGSGRTAVASDHF